MTTQEKIYEMLTESTGQHFLDSGGSNNRYWQQNQKKTLEDFQNEKHFQVEKNEYGDNQVEYLLTISLFHHLSDSLTYDEQETNNLNAFLKSKGLYSDMEGIDEYAAAKYPGGQLKSINSYNEECNLSQTIQFYYVGDFYESDIIYLQIHNGADVRGGYTDIVAFKVDWDMLLNWYYSEEDILDQFVPCLICNDDDCIDYYYSNGYLIGKNGTHITNNMVTSFTLPNFYKQTIKN